MRPELGERPIIYGICHLHRRAGGKSRPVALPRPAGRGASLPAFNSQTVVDARRMPKTSGSFTLGDLRAGRKKGSRDKLGRDFFQALSEDFAEHGRGVITIVRNEDPGLYLRIVASTMPKEFTVERVTSELSDDELDEMIIREREQIAKSREQPLLIEAKLADDDRAGATVPAE
jgi:hypothetical protein